MRAIVFPNVTQANRFVAFIDRLLDLPKPGTTTWTIPLVRSDGRAAVVFKDRKLARFLGQSRVINGTNYTLRGADIVTLDASWFPTIADPRSG